jgi:hypothetical protein
MEMSCEVRIVANGGTGISSVEGSGSSVIMLNKYVGFNESTVCIVDPAFSVESLIIGTYSTDRRTAIMHIMCPMTGPEAATGHRKLYYSSLKAQFIISRYTFVAFNTKYGLIN